jgi:hypothetical protein
MAAPGAPATPGRTVAVTVDNKAACGWQAAMKNIPSNKTNRQIFLAIISKR